VLLHTSSGAPPAVRLLARAGDAWAAILPAHARPCRHWLGGVGQPGACCARLACSPGLIVALMVDSQMRHLRPSTAALLLQRGNSNDLTSAGDGCERGRAPGAMCNSAVETEAARLHGALVCVRVWSWWCCVRACEATSDIITRCSLSCPRHVAAASARACVSHTRRRLTPAVGGG
jgi:hypothetical protein